MTNLRTIYRLIRELRGHYPDLSVLDIVTVALEELLYFHLFHRH